MDQVRSPLSKKAGNTHKPGDPASLTHHVNRDTMLFKFARQARPVMENGHCQMDAGCCQVGSHIDE
jgi:hypothetical protein